MPSTSKSFAAVDLGASSGRVMVGTVHSGGLHLNEVHRFPNRPVRIHDALHWDVLSLYQGVLDGLRQAGLAAGGRLDGVGVDSWAVDYGLLDSTGALLGNPVHYRDDRTAGVAERVRALIPPEELYGATGLQHLPFNTIYQLVAAQGTPLLAAAERLLMIPDLISYWLTGEAGTEITNASTTQLIDPRTRNWSADVAARAGIDLLLFPPLRSPGDPAGELLPQILDQTGLDGPTAVTAVGSHDTASAVVGVPAAGENFAYIATGTWSLVGVELEAPVLCDASRRANFTNELGVDGTVRYLRNVMGLWLLQECMRTWAAHNDPQELGPLLVAAAREQPLRSVVDAGDPAFIAPGDMPGRIAEACRRTGQPEPRTPAEITRCVLDSLALAHRRAVSEAQALSGKSVEVVHIVGGGVRNELLCQLTADACGLPVVAGPTEAAALGNVLVQARARGAVSGSLADLRELLRATQQLKHYTPADDSAAWTEAADRLKDVTCV
ncbi:rhamnulokinase family protein [Streptomyces sp. NPDC090073]|uniref:rhamnulokinase n=1 Tax=Streptomyces sp. NPDC090073 TaxID=3365936 RepID=UPI00382C0110